MGCLNYVQRDYLGHERGYTKIINEVQTHLDEIDALTTDVTTRVSGLCIAIIVDAFSGGGGVVRSRTASIVDQIERMPFKNRC
jgi:hypothetical protein